MARFFLTVLLLAMLTSVGMGAQDDLSNDPEMQRLLREYRATAAEILREFKAGGKTSLVYKEKREQLRQKTQAVYYYGIELVIKPESGSLFTEQERTLIKKREKALAAIWREEHGKTASENSPH